MRKGITNEYLKFVVVEWILFIKTASFSFPLMGVGEREADKKMVKSWWIFRIIECERWDIQILRDLKLLWDI